MTEMIYDKNEDKSDQCKLIIYIYKKVKITRRKKWVQKTSGKMIVGKLSVAFY